jgi:hypothetical protein
VVYPDSPFETPNAPLDDTNKTRGTPGVNGREAMAYWEAFRSFFDLESWGKNLGWLTLCVLIPIVGPLAIQGYLIGQIVRQHLNGDKDLVEYTWDRFGEYIGRGVWPFVVGLLMVFVMLPVMGIMGGVMFAVAGAGMPEAVAAIFAIFGGLLVLVLSVFLMLVMQPITVRACLLQSISGVFDMAFLKDFLSKMWLEIFLAMLFQTAIGMGLVIVGYMMCGLGLYPAIGLLMWTQFQLHRQLYEVYIFRGGTPIEIAPALAENP